MQHTKQLTKAMTMYWS